jgi:sugar/nucleoside kinase (ribokinase family)
MSILVVGSIALDTVETPFGKVKDSPGGSTLFFSAAASFFTPVNVVGVVGKDFDFSHIEFLKNKNVDFTGLKVEEGKTFRWGGYYHENMNQRDTLFTHLNVFERFQPEIPNNYCNSKFIFLANIHPELQLHVLKSIDSPTLSVLDTMNYWITGSRKSLDNVIKKVDVLILNDEETRELTGIYNITKASYELLKQGPKVLVIKKGEHGAVLISRDDYFMIPAFPVENVVDPTGAGDSFAGGFVGYLASCSKLNKDAFRRAIVYGSILASFNVESFSFNNLKNISRKDIDNRLTRFRKITNF